MDAALREEIQKVKETYLPGMRVRLTKMDDPQAPPVGTEGTVIKVDDIGTIKVAWETGGSLGVVLGEDKVEILAQNEVKENSEFENLSASELLKVYANYGEADTFSIISGLPKEQLADCYYNKAPLPELGEDIKRLLAQQLQKIDTQAHNRIRQLAKKTKLSPNSLDACSHFYFCKYFTPNDVSGSHDKLTEIMVQDGFSEPRIGLMMDYMLNVELVKKPDTRKQFGKVLHDNHLEKISKILDCPEINPKTHPPDGKGSKIVR